MSMIGYMSGRTRLTSDESKPRTSVDLIDKGRSQEREEVAGVESVPNSRNEEGNVLSKSSKAARNAQVDVVAQPAISGKVPVLTDLLQGLCSLESNNSDVGRCVPLQISVLILTIVSDSNEDVSGLGKEPGNVVLRALESSGPPNVEQSEAMNM
jgi:hypothetical protein